MSRSQKKYINNVKAMKTLIIYDSIHGNTEKIAKAIREEIPGEARVLRVGNENPLDAEKFNLLIVGSPTHGGRPTKAIQDFIKQINETSLKGTNVAAFDTRFSSGWVKIFGFAAERIAEGLKRKGGVLAASPKGFFVKGTEGPLKEGEVGNAKLWASEIVKSVNDSVKKSN